MINRKLFFGKKYLKRLDDSTIIMFELESGKYSKKIYELNKIPNKKLQSIVWGIETKNHYPHLQGRLVDLKREHAKRIEKYAKFSVGDKILINWNEYSTPKDVVHIYRISSYESVWWAPERPFGKPIKIKYRVNCVTNDRLSSVEKIYSSDLLDSIRAIKISDNEAEVVNALYG